MSNELTHTLQATLPKTVKAVNCIQGMAQKQGF